MSLLTTAMIPGSQKQKKPKPKADASDTGMMASADFDQSKRSVTGQLNGLLKSNNPYMKRARTAGKEFANNRGLLNSSIAAGAVEGAAIDAAVPIATAEADIQDRTYQSLLKHEQNLDLNKQDFNFDKKLDDHQTQNQIERDAVEATGNLQGKYLDTITKLSNNAAVSINEIETAQGIPQDQKNKMIQNTIKRRDADLAWTRLLYSNMPAWNFDWVENDNMPSAPGLGVQNQRPENFGDGI